MTGLTHISTFTNDTDKNESPVIRVLRSYFVKLEEEQREAIQSRDQNSEAIVQER